MSDKREFKTKVVVETTPELAFEALTQASELREWFSDQAWTQAQPEGRYALHWNQGYHVEGKFVELEAPHRAVVTWLGSGEPGETKVKFEVKAIDDGVKVTVVHKGLGLGDEWDEPLKEAEKGWTNGLENLKSTLETGVDLRIARQPFMGILLGLLDAERAAKENIAVDKGIYVNGTLEDSGARAAGLEKGDVIVSFGGQETPGFQELNVALRAHIAGDVVEVKLMRGQEWRTVEMKLGQRPSIDVPETAEGLAELVAERYAEADTELKAALEGVSEEEAEQQPAEGEWSVKQVLAHLSIGERDLQSFFAAVAVNGWQDGGPGNPTAILGRLAAVQASAPTLKALLERFFADEAETIAFLRGLPEETLVHKARYYRIGQFMALGPIHTRDHIEQIKNAIEAVRKRE